MRTGIALTRADAVLDGELAIEKALEGQKTRAITDVGGRHHPQG